MLLPLQLLTVSISLREVTDYLRIHIVHLALRHGGLEARLSLFVKQSSVKKQL